LQHALCLQHELRLQYELCLRGLLAASLYFCTSTASKLHTSAARHAYCHFNDALLIEKALRPQAASVFAFLYE
jgi:hypothetical protein